MADVKDTDFPATTTLDPTDIIAVVTDVGGTPTNKKITHANLKAGISPCTVLWSDVDSVVLENADMPGDVRSKNIPANTFVNDGDWVEIIEEIYPDNDGCSLRYFVGGAQVTDDSTLGLANNASHCILHVMLTRMNSDTLRVVAWANTNAQAAIGGWTDATSGQEILITGLTFSGVIVAKSNMFAGNPDNVYSKTCKAIKYTAP